MVARGQGAVVNIASIMAYQVSKYIMAYQVSKYIIAYQVSKYTSDMVKIPHNIFLKLYPICRKNLHEFSSS